MLFLLTAGKGKTDSSLLQTAAKNGSVLCQRRTCFVRGCELGTETGVIIDSPRSSKRVHEVVKRCTTVSRVKVPRKQML